MTQSELFVPRPTPVDQRVETEALNEPLELTVGHRAFVEIHEVRANAPLGKETQRFSRLRAFLDAEYLDFHLLSTR